MSQKGWHATFMSKTDEQLSGSGGHFHLSLLDKENKNIFSDGKASDGLSDIARWFIGGQIRHADAICALANGTVNSYKRLVPNSFAPVYASWGYEHRSTMIRIPHGRDKKTHIESRLPKRLDVAIDALLSNKMFTNFFGSCFIDRYVALCLHEFERYERYERTISDWERKEYFHLF
ncbi:glutamine synthetase [Aneurinibacillus migulanus]|nr:glutamine synthetase [Aneurinibacillus migulanus]